jgi:hypothetical protein
MTIASLSRSKKKLKPGDIVEIEWLDTHSTDRLSMDELQEMDDPGPTIAYGVVIKNSQDYVTIASELCLDPFSDGNWVEQIPHGTISTIRILARRRLDNLW